jgi:hypothetical protein
MVVDVEKSERSSVTEGTAVVRKPMARQDDFSGYTEEELLADKAAVRRLDLTVVPLCGLVYLLNFLDRSNLGKYVQFPPLPAVFSS